MSGRQNLLADARKFAAMFPAFVQAAEILGEVDSLDQAVEEAKARIADIRQRESEARESSDAEIGKLNDQREANRKEAEEIIENANRRGEEIKSAALRQAQSEASDILEKAAVEGERAKERLMASVSAQQVALDNLQKQIAAATGALAEKQKATADAEDRLVRLERDVAKAQARHDELHNHIAALKQRFA